MSWTKLLADKRTTAEPTSKNELDELRAMARLNLKDAQIAQLSSQGRFEFAYNAARLMATIAIRASGYRVIAKNGFHYFTFQALQAADKSFVAVALYFDTARDKRNDFSYDAAISISDADADDLLKEAAQFSIDLEAWITANHPMLKA